MPLESGVQQTYQNTEATNSIYRYQCVGEYVVGSEHYPINRMNVKSIVVDYDYENNNFPLLYFTLALSTKILDIIIRNQDKGIFVMNIQKCIYNSDMPDLWKDYIKDTFVYFVSSDINKTDSRDYENANEGREDIMKDLVVGMISQKLLNSNKKVVNGIINGNMASAIYYVANSRPLVMEPLHNNVELKNVFLPPVNSVAKAIEYLYSYRVFYNSRYRYFMDFDTSYLLSESGNAVPKKGDLINTVLITFKNDYDNASKSQGMIVDEKTKCYKIEVAGTDVELASYGPENKSTTDVSYTATDGTHGGVTISALNKDTNLTKKVTNVRVPNGNIGLITKEQTKEQDDETRLFFYKIDLDTSALTMNKEYQIYADEVYPGKNYSGKYMLQRKRELYIKSSNGLDDRFTMSTLLLFEKC